MEVTKALKNLPHRPGVYLFKNQDKEVMYVGKAINLSRRVKSYFQGQPREFANQIVDIEIIETTSEFDALLLEAKLIRHYKPKYNAITKDDKSPLYIVLTLSEALPRILYARKTQLARLVKNKRDSVFGPFQSATMVRAMMRELRPVSPYCMQKERNGRPCFYTHLGLCKPCPSVIKTTSEKLAYRKNLFRLKNILSGKTTFVLRQMEKEMNHLARTEQFESASAIRNRIHAYYAILSKRYDPTVYLQSEGTSEIYAAELEALQTALQPHFRELDRLTRIECIDISNISGKHAVGSLVVLTNGRIDKSSYRRFRVRTVRGTNDPAMIAEIVSRRFSHPEWPMPNLLVIDGGKGQIRAAMHAPVPVIGLAKRFEEIIIPKGDGWKILRLDLTSPAMHVVQRIRDEAHRFALSYHRQLRDRVATLN